MKPENYHKLYPARSPDAVHAVVIREFDDSAEFCCVNTSKLSNVSFYKDIIRAINPVSISGK